MRRTRKITSAGFTPLRSGELLVDFQLWDLHGIEMIGRDYVTVNWSRSIPPSLRGYLVNGKSLNTAFTLGDSLRPLHSGIASPECHSALSMMRCTRWRRAWITFPTPYVEVSRSSSMHMRRTLNGA